MVFKMIGAALIVISCGSVGFYLAAQHRAEERSLRNLASILGHMECELRYTLMPLPTLCRQAALTYPQMPGKLFNDLAITMDSQITPDMPSCVKQVLDKNRNLPEITKGVIANLGETIGRFDLEGQLKGLAIAQDECKRNLNMLENNRDSRLRSYQTLGLCAGAALAILLI